MKNIKYKEWRLLIPDQLDDEMAKSLFDTVQSGNFTLRSILKDTYRSQVKRISVFDKDLVLKIPNEKNTRTWIRFLTWFRTGEAFKNLKGMQLLQENGILTSTPVVAAEKRSLGMVVDSWLIYEFLDGQSCVDLPSSHQAVVSALNYLHGKKLLHGDPQIRNFIQRDQGIYTIDSNPKKLGLTGFDLGYEWAYLRKSYPGIERFYGKINESKWYRFAVQFDLIDRKLARFRKKIRAFFKSF